MFKPSSITSDKIITAVGVDMVKATAKFDKDPKQHLQMGKFKLDGKSFKLALDGELTTNGIAENKWTNPKTGKATTSFSIGIAISDEDLEFLDGVSNILVKLLHDPDYELTNIVKNDIIYLKVKDKEIFNELSNVTWPTLSHGQKFLVVLDLKFYINFKDLKAGLVLQPVKYVFDTSTD